MQSIYELFTDNNNILIIFSQVETNIKTKLVHTIQQFFTINFKNDIVHLDDKTSPITYRKILNKANDRVCLFNDNIKLPQQLLLHSLMKKINLIHATQYIQNIIPTIIHAYNFIFILHEPNQKQQLIISTKLKIPINIISTIQPGTFLFYNTTTHDFRVCTL